MLKSIVCLGLLFLATSHAVRFELNDSIRQVLAALRPSDLPPSVQASLITTQGRGPSDSSHWCCINEQPVTTETKTKIEYATHMVVTKTKVGYVDCGFLGFSKCSHWVTSQRPATYTFIQTFQVPNMVACNDHEMKCCAGYMLVAGNCHKISELMENQALFQLFHQLGLLGTNPVGK